MRSCSLVNPTWSFRRSSKNHPPSRNNLRKSNVPLWLTGLKWNKKKWMRPLELLLSSRRLFWRGNPNKPGVISTKHSFWVAVKSKRILIWLVTPCYSNWSQSDRECARQRDAVSVPPKKTTTIREVIGKPQKAALCRGRVVLRPAWRPCFPVTNSFVSCSNATQ